MLEPAAAGPGGKITILATATGSRINVTGDPGSAGTPPIDTIRADKGSVDIRNTGANGATPAIGLLIANPSGYGDVPMTMSFTPSGLVAPIPNDTQGRSVVTGWLMRSSVSCGSN